MTFQQQCNDKHNKNYQAYLKDSYRKPVSKKRKTSRSLTPYFWAFVIGAPLITTVITKL